jgi:hypothetical protein
VEEFESLTLLQQELDPYIGITVKVNEDDIYIRGEVKDIKFGKRSGVRLYTIMYEDGVVEEYTLMRLLIFADPRGIDAMALKRAWAGKIPCSVCKKGHSRRSWDIVMASKFFFARLAISMVIGSTLWRLINAVTVTSQVVV